MNRKTRLFFAVSVLAGAFCPALLAQSDGYVTNSNQRGVLPFGSYQLGRIDNVNLATGAVNFDIPLWTREGRGLDWSERVHYSSKLWIMEPMYSPANPSQVLEFDWTRSAFAAASTGTPVGRLEKQEQFYECVYVAPDGKKTVFDARVRSAFTWEDASGATVRFPNRDYTAGSTLDCDKTSDFRLTLGNSDNGVMELDTSSDPYVLRHKDGRLIEIPFSGGLSTLKDANGNYIDSLDTVGRQAGVLKDSGGSTRTFPTTYGSMSVTPAFPTSHCGSIPIGKYTQNLNVLRRIDLPDGLAYTFTYHPTFGEITRIDLPTGGYVRYDWTTHALVDNPPDSALSCGYLDARRVSARHVSADGVNEDTWTYAYSKDGQGRYITTVVDPEGNKTVHTFLADGIHEVKTEIYQGASTLVQTIDNTWKSDFAPVASHPGDDQLDYDGKNWRLASVSRNRPLASGAGYISQEAYVWDGDSSSSVESRVNLLEKREYNWGIDGPGGLKRRTAHGYLHDTNANYENRHILDRMAFTRVYDPNSTLMAQTERRYDTRPLAATSGVVQHDYAGYAASMNVRGNLTEERRWLDTDGSWLTTVHTYDDLGNRVSTTDPNGNTTTFSHQDSWANTACAPSGGAARAWLTRAVNAKGQATSWTWYPCSSLPATASDPNNAVTSWTYDGVDRLTRESFPDGGQTNIFHSDTRLNSVWLGSYVFKNRSSALPLRSKTFTRIETSPTLLESSALAVHDGLGRVSMAGSSNGSRRDWTRTEYDGLGRVRRTSNPVTLADDTDTPSASSFSLWTTTSRDPLGRTVKIAYPDWTPSAPQETVWAYAANQTTRTDPSGSILRSWSDALGRLTQVRECNPDNGSLVSGHFTTKYKYDALDNLTMVIQDQQTRVFTYDSLSRLVAESEPEWGTETANGTATYEYDANFNLTKRTDAAGTETVYTYDQLDRILTTAYSDGTTPAVTYGYDLAANGVGRRTSMTDGTGSSAYQYDAMGRATRITRTQNGAATLQIDHSWNQAGGLESEAWPGIFDGPGGPSDPVAVHYAYDSSGRQRSAWWGNSGITQNLVDGRSMTYDGSGAVATTWNSNLTTETVGYNKRLQPETRLVQGPAGQVLLNLAHSYAKPSSPNYNGNNGNVWSVVEWTPGYTNRTQNYDYDYLNRITSAASPGGGWSMTFTHDRWGNRTAQTGSGGAPTRQFAVSGDSNRITTPGHGYDDAGRMTAEPGETYQYDAGGRLKSVNYGALGAHGYDGDGRRTKKTYGGVATHYFYDALGNPVWEYKPATNLWERVRLHFDGKPLAVKTASEDILWLHADNLGTPRVKTDSTGAVPLGGGVPYRDWYHPYGEQINTPVDPLTHRFTGQERDFESGLDYFGARHYSPTLGRFLTVDPSRKSVDSAHPQSWNRYSYSLNNPLAFIDPNGEEPIKVDRPTAGIEDFPSGPDLAAMVYMSAMEYAASLPTPADQMFFGVVFSGLLPHNDTESGLTLLTAALGGAAGRALSMEAGGAARVGGTLAIEEGLLAREGAIIASNGTEITGFTRHGINRVVGDGAKRAGVKPSALLDALRNPAKIVEGVDKYGRPFQVFHGEAARVVVNPKTGKIISVNPLSSAGAQ